MIQKVHRLLSASFNRAVRYGWIAAIPCGRATKPRTSSPEIEPPTPEQVRDVIADAENVHEDLAVCLRLAAATAARRTGRFEWVDLKGARLTIRPSRAEPLPRHAVARRSVPVPTVSNRLGHTSSAVTLDVDGHWQPEQDREAADVIARLLG